jgi:MFS superfamily sulfate permease-like transporter
MDDGLITAWYPSWLWSLPLIVLTVVIHVVGLSLINEKVVRPLSGIAQRRQFTAGFVIIMAVVAWLVTLLHAIEGFVWAFAYERLGALPNTTAAVLYSFSAMTAYGHANIVLEQHWQLMGALEALNGLMLFGLTTAFMFAVIERVWRLRRRSRASGE